MGRLLHSGILSLDGYTVDDEGSFGWAMPSPEVEDALTEQTADVSTFLYGRRMYETMAIWETEPAAQDDTPDSRWAQVWRATDKVVYSTTLDDVWTSRTRLERRFEPDAVRALVRAADGDVTVEGPTLAATALRAGLVDQVDVVIVPVIVGGGTPFLPDGIHLDLSLVETTRFDNGMVQLRYTVG
ncbi:dihydrofolate reductase family protein [Aeromicrobium sp. CTD01-1L150]|uniref:dihydrofolate reductase family protein n=1 Tax=Aeromicrobium sp. CTD01-1L150 TaxID=3341830 RepID=UPI0035C14391